MSDEKLMKAETRAKIAGLKAEIAQATCAVVLAQNEEADESDPLAAAKHAVKVAELRLALAQKRLELAEVRASADF